MNLMRFSVKLWIRAELTVSTKHQAYALSLTRGGRDEMAAILQMIFSNILFNENGGILIQISLKYVLTGSINNKPDLVQIMVWHQLGEPFSQTVLN